MLLNFLSVAVGGSLGAMLRYAIALICMQLFGSTFPWGTMIANLLGCLVIGVVLGFGIQKEFETHYLLIGVGILGALTTFSTFSAETLQMAMNGQWLTSILNILANVLGSLAACFLGLLFSRLATGS